MRRMYRAKVVVDDRDEVVKRRRKGYKTKNYAKAKGRQVGKPVKGLKYLIRGR